MCYTGPRPRIQAGRELRACTPSDRGFGPPAGVSRVTCISPFGACRAQDSRHPCRHPDRCDNQGVKTIKEGHIYLNKAAITRFVGMFRVRGRWPKVFGRRSLRRTMKLRQATGRKYISSHLLYASQIGSGKNDRILVVTKVGWEAKGAEIRDSQGPVCDPI